MAGSSHNYSMNINIKAQADGISKTNKEITQLNNEVKGLDGKKISLNIQLGGNASKDIQSVVKSIGSIEKSLNSLSGKGLQSIEQSFSALTKAANDVVSGIGSIQKSLDGLSGRGPESVASSMGDINKTAQDAASGVGQVSTAADGISTGNAEELAAALSEIADMARDAASATSKISEVGGLGDNWNNSYGGRYGGMRYTGQGKGISDLVSFIGGGKNSYQLTVENAMNKTRNMAVAKSWTPEDDVSGMDAYWALDSATNHSLMSLNSLAAGINATAATTGASAKDIKNHARDFADFGTMVMGLGYTEDVAQTAVMKLGRGLHGTFAALDQYGITKESLMNTGLWNGDESDLDGYMAAVSSYSRLMSENLLGTTTGQMATLSKSASLGGYALGEMEAQSMRDVVGLYKELDDSMRFWTKSLNIPWLSGADVHDNMGQKVLTRIPMGADGKPKEYIDYNNNGQYDEKTDEAIAESLYVSNQPGTEGKIVNDKGEVVYNSIQDAYNAGFDQKRTGIGLSTLIIGADQVISTYKTIKDTILGTFAELRDLRRIRQVGLRNIFKGDDYDLLDDHIVKKAKTDACRTMNEDCPANGGGKGGSGKGKNKKKRNRLGRWKNSISNKIDKLSGKYNQYDNPIGPTPKPKPQITVPEEHFPQREKYSSHNVKPTLNRKQYPIGISPDSKTKTSKLHFAESVVDPSTGKNLKGLKEEKAILNRGRLGEGYFTGRFGSDVGAYEKEIAKYEKIANSDNISSRTKSHADAQLNSLHNELAHTKRGLSHNEKYDKLSKKTSEANSNTGRKVSREELARPKPKGISSIEGKTGLPSKKEYMNKYGGFQKRTLGAIWETKNLKRKAKDYIKTKQRLVKDEWDKGLFKGRGKEARYTKIGSRLPYQAWDKVKSGASSLNTRLGDSFLGTQYGALKRQGSTLKNAVKDSRAWQTLSPIGGAAKTAGSTVKSQVVGNTKALGRMTGFTPWFMSTKTGQKLNKGYQNIKQQGVKTTVGGKLSKVGGALKAGGSRVMGAAATGMGKVAGGLGKISGIVGGIGGAFMGLLGPIGAVIMAVTLFTSLCDALGIDLSPLQEAFGGFIQAIQPAIQALNQWISSFAQQLGPALTALGQALSPILEMIGGLISGGLGALAGVLGPILEGIGAIFGGGSGEGMFDGLADGLGGLAEVFQQLGPVVQGFWEMMGQGAEGVGGFLGGIFDGIGMYITHVVQEWANTISLFWTTIAQGISTAISTVATAITNSITSIATTVGSAITTVATASISAILGLGGAIGSAIVSILGGIATGIIMIGTAIGGYILTIGTIASGVVTMMGASIAGAMSMIGIGIATVITAISSAVIMGITGLATAITAGILMISTAILTSFTGFALVVATATAEAYATLLAFQGTAVGLMGTIASDMVNAFENNFTGIAAAVDAEMSGAYDRLCYWGDLMVAKAGQIGADVQANYKSNSGIGSPGYVWLMTDAEWQGALNALRTGGMAMVKTAGTVAQKLAHNYQSSKPQNLFQEDMGVSASVPFVKPPQIKEPKVSKDIRQQRANAVPQSPVFNYNHYGDVDNEERMQKTMKYFSDRIDFENKRANRTV